MATIAAIAAIAAIADVLHEAAETHHVVWRITDGDDPDWASWYADWLLDLSELPAFSAASRSAAISSTRSFNPSREHVESGLSKRWEDKNARGLSDQFAA